MELLLEDMHNYEVKKAAESVDWKLVKSKYSDILLGIFDGAA